MAIFKVGDKVRCVRRREGMYFLPGIVYEVLEVHPIYGLTIKGSLYGDITCIDPTRFELVKPKERKKNKYGYTETQLEVIDKINEMETRFNSRKEQKADNHAQF